MKTIEFLSYLNSLDIQLLAEGERLRVNAPTGVLTPDLRAELAEHKEELLALMDQVNVAAEASPPGLVAVSRAQNLPLSFGQQRLWFLNQLEPGNATYNMASAYRIRGPLKVSWLEQSFKEIIQRHQVFQTSFSVVEGQPVQRIRPSQTVPVQNIDLRNMPEPEREAEVQRLMLQERRWSFKLEQGPLLRTTLLRLGEQEHVLLMTMHHIIADGWSFGVLFGELAVLYQAYACGKSAKLAELAIQYADFAVWQREWLQGEVLERQLGYWKQQLAGAPLAIELPPDRPRAAVQSHQGATQGLSLSTKLSDAVRALSRQEGVTLFMTLLAAFKVLLYRYAAQEDIVVGTPMANRNRPEIEGLIGFFVNTLVLRTDLSGNPSFGTLLARVREVALGAYAHQELPFEKLVEELQPERDQSRSPLFQVFFNMLSLEEQGLELSGLSVERLAPADPASKFDLTLYASDHKEELEFQLLYNADLFDDETMSQMLNHYQTLLESIVAQPETPLLSLSLVGPDQPERSSVRPKQAKPVNPFVEFSQEEIEQSIPARFGQQVKQHGHKVAIKTRKQEWSYESLDRAANGVAQAIVKQYGPGPGRMALLFEHDGLMIAGLLGILKAGKSYVPLDPTYPEERLTYILADAQVAALVTNHQNEPVARRLSHNSLHLINIEEIDLRLTGEPDLPISSDTLAYILYTSGSTGRPKGVRQDHRNVLHYIRNYTNDLHISAKDKITLLASYSFDAAVMDIFGALLNGASLYPLNIKEEGISCLAQWLAEQEITIYHSTPTVYRYFVETLSGQEAFSRLRLVVLGGEEVHRQDVELYKKHFPPACTLVNLFGASEASIGLQCFINQETSLSRQTVSIGYPVEKTEILLLTEAGEAAAVYGEIAIRSPYIAVGYWQQPELTEASFLPDPEGGNRRIYRTGDMGRLRPDNSFEFVGRKDFQIKIRGFRIEPGEVEGVLSQHAAVRETTVVAREDIAGEKRLVAYVVPNQAQSPRPAELRSFLNQRLPNYMVPSAFVVLEALPLTPNGKVDHRALPAPQLPRQDQDSQDQVPKGSMEQCLARMWAGLLDIEQVGRRDNFFELGGHSLLAIRLFDQIERAYGRKLPLASLFQAPTIEQLALLIDQDPKFKTGTSCLVEIQPKGSRPPFFCVHGIGGHVLRYYDLPTHLGQDQPFYGLQSQGLDGNRELFQSIEEMAAHYVTEIQTVQSEGPILIGGLSLGCFVAYEMACQLQARGHSVGLVALFDGHASRLPGYYRALSRLGRIRHKERTLTEKVRYHAANVSHLPHAEKLTYVQKKIIWKVSRANSNHHQNQSVSVPENLRKIYRTNGRALSRYVPQPYPGRVTLFRAFTSRGTYHGWDHFVLGGVDTHDIPGDHTSIVAEPHVKILARKLSACIDNIL